ncbi:AAA family ATPase [Xylanibacter rarus]|uniref:AAA family ATPase n=1 Tax=Xylanibacter rarus TaxID=1676614 RepID=UPI003FEF1BD7
MNYYIKKIHINNLFHLRNIDIPIAYKKAPHLIITGKNGSGKTVLLNAMANFLDNISDNTILGVRKVGEKLDISIEHQQIDMTEINLDFFNATGLIYSYQNGDFIMAFYEAARKVKMFEPKNPTKPVLVNRAPIRITSTNQFLNFLSDLKIQEALARNENQIKDADEINKWFVDFTEILRQIFQDNDLCLKFNYKDYSFHILSHGKEFKFTELSDGYAAILDIVVDLILKMQSKNSLTRAYKKKGIVLIDEVETHLHLEMQKMIMPILTKVFPNIQFIVTTHSPFVLNSLENAVAYDLEHQEVISDLPQYSYEALAEGYFGVSSESSYMKMQLEKLANLLQKGKLTDLDKYEIRLLIADLDKVPESVSPNIVGDYFAIKTKYASVIKSVLA